MNLQLFGALVHSSALIRTLVLPFAFFTAQVFRTIVIHPRATQIICWVLRFALSSVCKSDYVLQDFVRVLLNVSRDRNLQVIREDKQLVLEQIPFIVPFLDLLVLEVSDFLIQVFFDLDDLLQLLKL